MKKTIILFVALLAVGVVNAQISFGVKAGVGVAQEKLSVAGFSPRLNPGNKVGFYAGPTLTIGSGVVSFHTELTYNLEGMRVAVSDLEFDSDMIEELFPELDPGDLSILDGYKFNGALAVHYHNLRLPLMVKIRPAGGLGILAGPYVSCRVAVGASASGDLKTGLEAGGIYKESMKEIRTGVSDAVRMFDMGLAFGVEYETPMGVFFEARYNMGLLNRINKDELEIDGSGTGTPRNKYSALQIGMGLKF